MGLEIVREFDNLTKKFYSIFDDEYLNEWGESSEIYLGIRSEFVREEVGVVLDSFYPVARPQMQSKEIQKIETLPVSGKAVKSRIEKVEQDSSEDVIVSDKNIKIVFQLPINNKKENVKVVANEDYSITISHLNNEGKRCTRTLDIPYNIDSEAAKATYKNGILEVKFDRQ